jgi:hypothetical protein
MNLYRDGSVCIPWDVTSNGREPGRRYVIISKSGIAVCVRIDSPAYGQIFQD